MIHLKDIANKKMKAHTAAARGIMLVAKESYFDFMNANRESILQCAIMSGIAAAKRTAADFALCFSVEILSVEIDITPSDNILRSSDINAREFINAFKPKKFNLKNLDSKNTQPSAPIALESDGEIISINKLKEAKKKFIDTQNAHIHHLHHTQKSPNAKCGFISVVNIKALSRIKPNMECLNALNAVHLSLFNMLNAKDVNVIEMRLE